MNIQTIFPAVFIWILSNMVSSCATFGCANRVKKGSGISFHRFPKKGLELEKQWITAIRRKNWSPSKTSCLCSEHFDRSCFLRERQIVGFIKMQSHLYFHNFQSTCKNLTSKESLLRSAS